MIIGKHKKVWHLQRKLYEKVCNTKNMQNRKAQYEMMKHEQNIYKNNTL